MNYPNSNEWSNAYPTTPDEESETLLGAHRAIRRSWYATIAAILFVCGSRAIHHPHRGLDDPEEVLIGLAVFAVVAGFAFGVSGVIRGMPCGAGRTILFGAIPLLLNGGLLAAFLWVMTHHR